MNTKLSFQVTAKQAKMLEKLGRNINLSEYLRKNLDSILKELGIFVEEDGEQNAK